jgi:hypothetical protein
MTKTSAVTFHRWDDMPKERVTDLISPCARRRARAAPPVITRA